MVPPRASGPLRSRVALAVALIVAVLDQLSKHWALRHLTWGWAQPFWPGLLNLQLVHNTGAAFSLFTGQPKLLGLVSLAVSLALLIWIVRQPPQGRWDSLGLGFLLGGALGNGIDRWRFGAVVDFLALVPIQFPVFNLADVAINLAVLCLFLHLSPWRRSGDKSDG
ncbi:MAG: signal peptidase II [Cyanobacteriota bacterium]|nr:signal peptidase II [Cyanobacteriota bacterium]